jgi:hypothetical protein
MGKFLTSLLMIAAVFAIYQLFTEYKAEKHATSNAWVERMRPLIKDHVSDAAATGEDPSVGEGSFLRIIYMAMRAEQDGYTMDDTIREAATGAGVSGTEASFIAQAVTESIAMARRMGALDPPNVLAMERGESPVAHASGWEDEKLVAGLLIPPTLAPEAVNALPNMRLVPESIRDMQGEHLTAEQVDKARAFLVQKIITPESMNAIRDKAAEQTKRK